MPTLDEFGREILDQTRLSFPVGYEQPEPLHLRIRRMVMHTLMEQSRGEEYETFEEADDFDVGDEPIGFDDVQTPYEADFDHLAGQTPSEGVNGPQNPVSGPSEAVSSESAPPQSDIQSAGPSAGGAE